MAEEDIYGNKRRYERMVANIDALALPVTSHGVRGRRKYHCKNPDNLQYFHRLHRIFESRDTSFTRRGRLLGILLFLTAATDKNLADCDREDVNEMVAKAHTVNHSSESKETFFKAMKYIWGQLFPELDSRGRVQDGVVPYPVRHVSTRVDRSRQRRRNDRLAESEIDRLIAYFGTDPQMQAYIALALESLGRPQEICYTRVGDVEIRDGAAKIWVSSHGKEGTKFLHCIESYPYVARWLARHPYRDDREAFLFIASGEKDRQLTPVNINKKLRLACARLGIERRITAYSLKRNGVTIRRLRGESDVEIQHVAGWTSTKQLKTYDLSSAEDVFSNQMSRKLGPSQVAAGESEKSVRRTCACGALAAPIDRLCGTCGRVLDPQQIEREQQADREIREVFARALQNPEASLAEIIAAYRKERVFWGSSS